MDQFRQIGEALGSLKALMVFRENLQINQRQCSLLLEILSSAYEMIAEEMRQNLRFEERQAKWRILEHPLKELYRVFKEGEAYIKQCLETKDWWAKAITLYQNTDCVELHIHNLFCCIPVIIEAVEIAGEVAGWDHEEMQKKRLVYSKKYQQEWKDPKLFHWRFGKQYLVTPEICRYLEVAWREDRWVLMNRVREKIGSGPTSKHDQKMSDLLARNLEFSSESTASGLKLLPSSLLVSSKDYQVRRRLGTGSQYKEIVWLGENFALRHVHGNDETLFDEVSALHSISHPNITYILCSFIDEDKKECFLVTELMSRDLSSYVKEVNGTRKRITFNLPIAVDIMLQIARGMEYLHSKKIYHGDLNPSNVLVKSRWNSSEGFVHAKISGFGLSSTKNSSSTNQKTASNPNPAPSGPLPFIWHAPEVLTEQDEIGSASPSSKFTEKSDVYSFGMICFELLTGKVPFEDTHLQGDKMSRNIRAGERPLFPFSSPKYLTNLTKRCWHTEPNQRPSFSSICRILRYVKRFFMMNPDFNSQIDPPVPSMDYCEIESRILNKFPSWEGPGPTPVSDIPFQMFVYTIVERERTNASLKENWESGSDSASVCGDETPMLVDDPFPPLIGRNSISPDPPAKSFLSLRRSPDTKPNRQSGTTKGRLLRPPVMSSSRSMRMNSESQLLTITPRMRRSSSSGHASDSELP